MQPQSQSIMKKRVRAELVPLNCELISHKTFLRFIYHYHYTILCDCRWSVHMWRCANANSMLLWMPLGKGIVPLVLIPHKPNGIHTTLHVTSLNCTITFSLSCHMHGTRTRTRTEKAYAHRKYLRAIFFSAVAAVSLNQFNGIIYHLTCPTHWLSWLDFTWLGWNWLQLIANLVKFQWSQLQKSHSVSFIIFNFCRFLMGNKTPLMNANCQFVRS